MKKALAIIVVSLFLLVSLIAISIDVTASTVEMEEYENVSPVMRVDNEFLIRYENDYVNEEIAFTDPTLTYEVQTTTDYSILDLLYYIPEERMQGGCANCWAWPSTSVIEIALRIQEGVMENRLSVQYMNTCGE